VVNAGAVVSSSSNDTIILGNGAGDVVNPPVHSTIILGNGADDVVNPNIFGNDENSITVGNGNDTIYVGFADTITGGKGQDSFVFNQTTPGLIGAVTINHFNPSKDVITLSSQLTTTVSYHDNSQGNAVITVDNNTSDTITLVGVHSAALHPSDFHFA
jgi:Ca2+-binding RTX toxin-like protein